MGNMIQLTVKCTANILTTSFFQSSNRRLDAGSVVKVKLGQMKPRCMGYKEYPVFHGWSRGFDKRLVRQSSALQHTCLHGWQLSQKPARRSTPLSHAVQPSGLLCCGSDGLERTARQHQRYGSVNLLFQTLSEDSSFLLLLAYQRIRGFAFMRYINPRLTLTLTKTYKTSIYTFACKLQVIKIITPERSLIIIKSYFSKPMN